MSDQPPFQPPSEPPYNPRFDPPTGQPASPATEAVAVSPIAPKSNPWKPAALGFAAAAVLGGGIVGVLALTGGDDEPRPAVAQAGTVVPGVQEQIDAANQQLDDVLASIPPVPSMPGIPDVAVPPTTPGNEDTSAGDSDVTISIPDAAELGAITECLGMADLLGELDLGALDLGELGQLPMGSLPNFSEMSPDELAELDVAELLELMFGEMSADLPGGTLPFDMSILEDLDLGELGEAGTLTPEQLQELIESQLAELGPLPSMPTMPGMPPMPSMPAVPGMPMLDPAQVEQCFAEVMPPG